MPAGMPIAMIRIIVNRARKALVSAPSPITLSTGS